MAEITTQADGTIVVRMLGNWIDRKTVMDTIAEVPKLVAKEYAEKHLAEFLAKVDAKEIVTLIAAAVAQKVADSYKREQGGWK